MKIILIIAFFFLVHFNSFSQKKILLEYKNEPLETILKKIEKSYDIKFSFNPKLIVGKTISISESNFLDNFIQKIQAQTSLQIEKISDRYYAIKNKTEEAYTICGVLLNNHTKKPISEAYIFNQNESKTAISDHRGYFQLYLSKSTDTINIKFLGYETKKVLASEMTYPECKEILLQEKNVELSEVLVTEYITSGVSQEKSTGAININPNKLGILPRLVDPDVLQSLQFLPGIQSPNEKASELHIRGGTSDHNLVLWDGIKMYNTAHFFGFLSVFNPFITENVKVYRSSTEAQYGERVAGVIDITSTSKIPKNVKASFGFNSTHSDAYIKIPVSKDFGIIISGKRSFSDLIESPNFRNTSNLVLQTTNGILHEAGMDANAESVEVDQKFYFNDYTIKAIANLTDKDVLSMSSVTSYNKLNYNYYIHNFPILNFSLTENRITNLKISNNGLGINWKKEWNQNTSHSMQIYSSNYDYNSFDQEQLYFIDNNSANSEITPLSDPGINTLTNKVRDFGGSFLFKWNINPTHKLKYGYQFSTLYSYFRQKDSENIIFSSGTSINNNITHAIHGEHLFSMHKDIKIKLGFRANYYSIVDKIYWEPRINMNFRLNKFLTAKISSEYKTQTIYQITTTSSFDIDLETNSWIQSDSESNVIKSNQLAGGLLFNKDNWRIEIEGYYKKNKGVTKLFNSIKGNRNRSKGDLEISGVDILLKKRIDAYRTWASYSFTDQNVVYEDLNNGESFPSRFDITHDFAWVHSYHWKNFEFSIGWNIRTGLPYTPTYTEEANDSSPINFIEGDTYSKRLSTYHRMDFSASYNFTPLRNKAWTSKLSFSLFNLYNQNNNVRRKYFARSHIDNSKELKDVNTFTSKITPNIACRINF